MNEHSVLYRLDPDDACNIQCKTGEPRAKWRHLVRCRDANDARKSLAILQGKREGA